MSLLVFFATVAFGFVSMFVFSVMGEYAVGMGVITAIATVGAFIVWAIREKSGDSKDKEQ